MREAPHHRSRSHPPDGGSSSLLRGQQQGPLLAPAPAAEPSHLLPRLLLLLVPDPAAHAAAEPHLLLLLEPGHGELWGACWGRLLVTGSSPAPVQHGPLRRSHGAHAMLDPAGHAAAGRRLHQLLQLFQPSHPWPLCPHDGSHCTAAVPHHHRAAPSEGPPPAAAVPAAGTPEKPGWWRGAGREGPQLPGRPCCGMLDRHALRCVRVARTHPA